MPAALTSPAAGQRSHTRKELERGSVPPLAEDHAVDGDKELLDRERVELVRVSLLRVVLRLRARRRLRQRLALPLTPSCPSSRGRVHIPVGKADSARRNGNRAVSWAF
jgi:hypothetical protein